MDRHTYALRLSTAQLPRAVFPASPTPWAVRVETPARDSVPEITEVDCHTSSSAPLSRPSL